jgi:hypothetical protein
MKKSEIHIEKSIEIIKKSQITIRYILEYNNRLEEFLNYIKKKEIKNSSSDEEIEDEENEDEGEKQLYKENEEKFSNFIEWDEIGISYFIYLIVVKNYEINYFLEFSIFQDFFLFKLIYPFILKLLNFHSSLKIG